MAAVLLAAFVVRIIGLGAQSFWYDEGYSALFVRHDLGYIIEQTGRLELNTPLYYAALHVWTRLAGDSEFSVRLLSIFAGVATVALAAPLASLLRRRARPAAALWALALMALWPVNVATSQEARMYALVTLLSFASVVVLLTRCLRAGRAQDWAAWAILCIAAFSAHVLAAFIIAAQVILVIAHYTIPIVTVRPRSMPAIRERVLKPAIAIVVINLITGAWSISLFSFRSAYGTSFTDRLDLADTFVRSMASVVLPRLQPETLMAYAAALAMVILAGVLIAGPGPARRIAVAGLISIAGIAAFCAITGKFAGRYSAIATPLVVGAFGMALGAPLGRWSRRAMTLAGAATLVVAAFGVLAWRIDPRYANEDFRGAADYLRHNVAPDERVVLVSGHFAPVWVYYYGDLGSIPIPNDPVLDVSHVLDYNRAVPLLNRSLAGMKGAWLLEWQQDVIDPTHLTTELLRRQAYGRWSEEPIPPEFLGLRLRHFRFVQPYQAMPDPLPQMQSRIEPIAEQERGLGALGCHQFTPPRTGDTTMEVVCFWTFAGVSGLDLDTRVSLRLVNASGAWLAQADQFLAAPYALPGVAIDKSLAAFYVMEIPRDLPAGSYELHAVPYFRTGPDATVEISPRVYTPVRVLSAH